MDYEDTINSNNINNNNNNSNDYDFSLLILNDKKVNIELEWPFQVNRISDAYKNKKIDKPTLLRHLNILVGDKTDYYLKIIEENPEISKLPSDFNLEATLRRTQELFDLYQTVLRQLQIQDQQQRKYQNKSTTPQQQSNCNCKSIFGKDVYHFNLFEYLGKYSNDHQMTDFCTETCCYFIVKKYQDVMEYANNRIFYYKSLKTENGCYNGCKVGFVEFYQYINCLIPSIAPLFKKVEDSIKFKIRNKKLTINKETTNNQSLYGLYWSTNNIISYEINSNTPIEE
ncbi:hypothetical protein RB653_008031 [Dictyostelium firmibasis]|uniref:Uncharacterized protein n=1 Tax=Dictyostelium firmibasis TaxID=79012 RepID=A0AAN7YTQ0_9MYCE